MHVLDKPMGGTEILTNKVRALLGSDLDPFNLLVTNCYPKDLKEDKINVLWQHNNIDDENMVKMMTYKPLIEKIDQFVFISNYQYEIFKTRFDLPAHRCTVLRNATDFVPVHEKPKDKVRLIYTSTPWRGLGILLQAFELLDRDDIELEVYSGLKIYGKEFVEDTGNKFEPLFEKARTMKNVIYTDYAPNDEIKKALKRSHIMAYPSAFPETSCLAAIEAMTAGCQFIGSSLGALPETTGAFSTLVPIEKITQKTSNMNQFIYRYAQVLDKAIDNYWSDETQNLLQEQVYYFNKHYTWNKLEKDWRSFLTRSLEMGKV